MQHNMNAPYISSIMNTEQLGAYVHRGLVSKTPNADESMFIYNYTAKAKYERAWDEVTLNCNGLILDKWNYVLGRSFPKFFNIEDVPSDNECFNRSFKVYGKMDGQRIIAFNHPTRDEIVYTTKEKFNSDPAIAAKHCINTAYPNFRLPENVTAIFELIHPSTRNVIDYGDIKGLWLVTCITNWSGRDYNLKQWEGNRVPEYVVPTGTNPHDVLYELDPDKYNRAGFVMVFDYPYTGSAKRVQVQSELFKSCEREIHGITVRKVWKYLSEGRNVEDLFASVHERQHDWIRDTITELNDAYKQTYADVQDIFWKSLKSFAPKGRESLKEYALNNRREFANHIKHSPHASLIFNILDGKDIVPALWRKIEPEKKVLSYA